LIRGDITKVVRDIGYAGADAVDFDAVDFDAVDFV
jgi:hypothetical protein